MSKADKDHFETYRLQTQVKHRLLTDYLPAYLNVLGTANKNILYIDGFAGRGFYRDDDGNEHLGSPLRALEVISSDPKYKDKVFCFFLSSIEGITLATWKKGSRRSSRKAPLRKSRISRTILFLVS